MREKMHAATRKEIPMLDFIFLLGVIGIFILSIGYAYACDRL